jgi:hypothetical protein
MLPEKVCRIKEPKEEGRMDEAWGAMSIADRQSGGPQALFGSRNSPRLGGSPLLIGANYDPGFPGAYHLSTFSRPASLPSTS